MTISNFYVKPLTVVLAGASGAIGQALQRQLLALPNLVQLYALSRSPELKNLDARITVVRLDSTCADDLNAFKQQLQADRACINVVINTVGLLHSATVKPEKSLSQLDFTVLAHSFSVNALAPIMLLQAVLPSLDKQNPAWIAHLSARVGSIQDNRLGGWYSYRASKAAQNQLIKTASIELKRTHPQLTCLQLHPGTVDSALSKPFQSQLKPAQLFTPEQSASFLLSVIASKTPLDTGTFWDWNNTAIPW